jgi:hypothetical protein
MNYKDMRERAQSAPHPLAEQGQEEEAQGKVSLKTISDAPFSSSTRHLNCRINSLRY